MTKNEKRKNSLNKTNISIYTIENQPLKILCTFPTHSHEVIKRMSILSLEIEIIFELDVSRHTSLMHFLLSLTSLGSYHFHFLIIDLFEIRAGVHKDQESNELDLYASRGQNCQ